MINERINVTKSFLPPIEQYQKYIQQIFDRSHLTNQGPLLKELEQRLSLYLKVENFHFVTNGTVALQLALNALGIKEGEIITTPFSYVATVSSILWERCTPIFVDIDPESFCIDPEKIERAITENTKAIMPVHVFGYPCEIEAIETVAKKYNLKVIYDAAHAFGSEYKEKSLLSYGDISTCSFHATKLFHTVEGGCVITKNKVVSEKIELIKRFGHNSDEHICLGVNAKASEFHAAMGLCNLNEIENIIEERRIISNYYDEMLKNSRLRKPKVLSNFQYNYAYYPVVCDKEETALKIIRVLSENNIFPRRYFYPSLNRLCYINSQACPISEDISTRILCLPLYCGLKREVVIKISQLIRNVL